MDTDNNYKMVILGSWIWINLTLERWLNKHQLVPIINLAAHGCVS